MIPTRASRPPDREPLPAGFRALVAAQFFSALADNALLIVTMALLARQGLAAWWAPLLKFGFTLAYVVLAPVIGPLADARPKVRLMLQMTAVKAIGVAALLAGLHPVLAFAVVGIGAAAYAPAKYGLTTELVAPRALVMANAWLEVSVVGAVLLGTVLGGALASPAWLAAAGPAAGLDEVFPAVGPLAASLLVLLAIHGLATLCNLRVPDSGARYPRANRAPSALWHDFVGANRTLWRDREGGLSLAATTIFWGAGATMQFIVLHWADAALGLPLHQAAMLQAIVAVGVVAGASIAGRWVPLSRARSMLVFGVLLGLMLPVLASVRSLPSALPLLLAAGAVGGLLVVPLNALLQHRGHVLLTAGRSIAVQGCNENASILLMLGLYAGLLHAGLPVVVVMWILGLAIAGAVAALMLLDRRRPATAAAAATH